MPLTMPYLRRLINANGHLQMDGTETKEELLDAVIWLRFHTYTECANPTVGQSMRALVPDESILYPVPKSSKKRWVNVDMRDEAL